LRLRKPATVRAAVPWQHRPMWKGCWHVRSPQRPGPDHGGLSRWAISQAGVAANRQPFVATLPYCSASMLFNAVPKAETSPLASLHRRYFCQIDAKPANLRNRFGPRLHSEERTPGTVSLTHSFRRRLHKNWLSEGEHHGRDCQPHRNQR